MNMKSVILLSIIMMFFLSGCISIDIYQKIKPGGEYDMTIEFGLPEMMMHGMTEQDDFEENMSSSINPEFRDRVSVNLTDSGFAYVFKNLKFGESEQFFIEEESNETSGQMSPGEMEFIDPNLYEYEDKGSSILYTIHIPEDESAQDDESGMNSEMLSQMFSVTYTVETFGDIIETNGVVDEQNSRRVEFDIDLLTGGDYYVEFKNGESGVFGWIMDNILYIIIGIIIVIVLVLFYITIHKRHGTPKGYNPDAHKLPASQPENMQQAPDQPAASQPPQVQQGGGPPQSQQQAQQPQNQGQFNQGNQ